ncbi:hypothetical protein [Halobacteriovorax sp.]|uniref:hypothetical protein n=1 Tax=Halobacteriovorax sp. TaxID=2020862 RepID=UPI0035640E3B
MHSLIASLALLFILSSCNEKVKECACTFEYAPVCSNGVQYDNKCLAKCNGALDITPGECKCNINSGEVCATPSMKECPEGMMCTQVMPSPRIYTNECEALKDKAQVTKMNNCN